MEVKEFLQKLNRLIAEYQSNGQNWKIEINGGRDGSISMRQEISSKPVGPQKTK